MTEPHAIKESWAIILNATAQTSGVSAREILSDQRDARVVDARYIAIKLIRDLRSGSQTQIGKALRRDHTTILHALHTWDQRIAKRPQVLALYATANERAQAELKAWRSARQKVRGEFSAAMVSA